MLYNQNASGVEEEEDDPLVNMMSMLCNRQSNEGSLACEQRPLHTLLMGYGFLVIFCLAIVGNCLNLLIYNSDQIKHYIAIRMLCTKLLMNTLTMLLFLPQALRIVRAWEPSSQMEMFYWRMWPYQVYFANVFGFCAMWLTILMTGECYLHVFFPSHSKTLATRRNLTRSYVFMAVSGMLLFLTYALNRTPVISVDMCGRQTVNIVSSPVPAIVLLDRIQAAGNLLCAIVVPLLLLVFMTGSIVYRLLFHHVESLSSNQHFSAEKRTVTRITLITTTLQLVSETPTVPVLLYATFAGPQVVHTSGVCEAHTIGLFLGLCNISLSFFVYIAFSSRFRNMMASRLRSLLSQVFPSTLTISKSRTYITGNERTSRTIIMPSPPSKQQEYECMLAENVMFDEADAFL